MAGSFEGLGWGMGDMDRGLCLVDVEWNVFGED